MKDNQNNNNSGQEKRPPNKKSRPDKHRYKKPFNSDNSSRRPKKGKYNQTRNQGNDPQRTTEQDGQQDQKGSRGHRSLEDERNEGARRGSQNNKRFSSSSRRGGPSNNERSNRPYNRDHRHRSSRPKNSKGELLRRWHELFTKHAMARRKYFDNFHRPADKRANYEREFYRCGENLLKFESTLNDLQKQWLEETLKKYPMENTYANNHHLPIKAEEVEQEGPFPDPHLTAQQHQRPSYKDDQEESTGSMEDYLKYKGQPSKESNPNN